MEETQQMITWQVITSMRSNTFNYGRLLKIGELASNCDETKDLHYYIITSVTRAYGRHYIAVEKPLTIWLGQSFFDTIPKKPVP